MNNIRLLISQRTLSEKGTGWHKEVFDNLRNKLNDPDFPCVFSKRAFRKELLMFIFVENNSNEELNHLIEALKEFIAIERKWNKEIDTAYPLVVAFSKDAISANNIEGYHNYGWSILQKLHDNDVAPWPENVGIDPDAEGWSMCFDGMQLFINMSTPENKKRRSRNLGGHLIFIINPRERFDVIAGENLIGRKIRNNIRKRVANYDGMERARQLGSYATGALEWWQYGLNKIS
ncbi:YqcI/YcgG family protein [Xenorhabdus eapokensis]|uniref:Uncharacterized protein n=1 Tax=Xenorhabdus eapokensis TaxID=1873482 RepID=A0A1Q5TEQ5_9GAMM|nr:YqcI/YcgG family protein [Xenorhabdus eapokensis]OKO98675.1 hypothetical protein Xedl_03817 [Xenorhabdus eapokensis]